MWIEWNVPYEVPCQALECIERHCGWAHSRRLQQSKKVRLELDELRLWSCHANMVIIVVINALLVAKMKYLL